jgi:hypothetical protein
MESRMAIRRRRDREATHRPTWPGGREAAAWRRRRALAEDARKSFAPRIDPSLKTISPHPRPAVLRRRGASVETERPARGVTEI